MQPAAFAHSWLRCSKAGCSFTEAHGSSGSSLPKHAMQLTDLCGKHTTTALPTAGPHPTARLHLQSRQQGTCTRATALPEVVSRAKQRHPGRVSVLLCEAEQARHEQGRQAEVRTGVGRNLSWARLGLTCGLHIVYAPPLRLLFTGLPIP